MSKRQDMKALTLSVLGADYALTKTDIGSDARLSRKGFVFETEVYEAAGLGHLCFLRMSALLGLMKMETAVIAAREKDLPLLNLDWVKAMGKETQIAELYDVQLVPYPAAAQAEFEAVKARDEALPEPETRPHWYDAILLPCSYHKSGRGFSACLNEAARGYLQIYAAQLKNAAPCDSREKSIKIRGFAETLFAQGGPAVDMFRKLFGEDVARRMILGYMYGVELT